MIVQVSIFLLLVTSTISQTYDRDHGKVPQPSNQLLSIESGSPYTLNDNNKWGPFPDLELSFTLDKEQIVDIYYSVVTISKPASFLCTSLTINGIDYDQFRVITGVESYHSNIVSSPLLLKAGEYNVKVIYRTPGSYKNISKGDYKTAVLKIKL